jgi:hypothetical protein
MRPTVLLPPGMLSTVQLAPAPSTPVAVNCRVCDKVMAAIFGERVIVPLGSLTKAVATVLAPPAPMQVSEKDVGAVTAPVRWLPPAAVVPVQPPDAVHDVALVELQVSVEAPPLVTVVGFAVNVAVGTIATVAVAAALMPPGPEQVREYEAFAVRAPVLWLPPAASVPLQPPDAVHDVALVELQVSAETPPRAIVVGFALNVAVGTMATVADAAALVPPAPVQVSEKDAGAVRAPVL